MKRDPGLMRAVKRGLGQKRFVACCLVDLGNHCPHALLIPAAPDCIVEMVGSCHEQVSGNSCSRADDAGSRATTTVTSARQSDRQDVARPGNEAVQYLPARKALHAGARAQVARLDRRSAPGPQRRHRAGASTRTMAFAHAVAARPGKGPGGTATRRDAQTAQHQAQPKVIQRVVLVFGLFDSVATSARCPFPAQFNSGVSDLVAPVEAKETSTQGSRPPQEKVGR